MKLKLDHAIAMILFIGTTTLADTPLFNTDPTTNAVNKYRAAVKAADDAREKALKGPKEILLKELNSSLSAAMKSNDLDTANKINTVIKKYKDENPTSDKFIGKWKDSGGGELVVKEGSIVYVPLQKKATWTTSGSKVIAKWDDGRIETIEFKEFVSTTVAGKPYSTWFRSE